MYVVLEGVDCVGKSTQIKLLKDYFKDALFTFEPGNTKLGKELRKLLLNSDFDISVTIFICVNSSDMFPNKIEII